MASVPVWRGRDGRLAPEDRARVDAAIDVSENIGAVIEEVEAARDVAGDHAKEAGKQADIATDAVVITLAQTEGALASAVAADLRAGSAEAAAVSAGQQRQAAESAALLLGAIPYATRAGLFATTGTATSKGYVYADTVLEQNGLYFWGASAWVKDVRDVGTLLNQARADLNNRVPATETTNVLTPLISVGGDLALWHDGEGFDGLPSPSFIARLDIPPFIPPAEPQLPQVAQHRPQVYNPERKRWTRMKLAGNKALRADQLRFAMIGDSWTQMSSGWLQDLRLMFGADGYDYAAAGYMDISQTHDGWAGVTNVRTGAWVVNDTTAPGPAKVLSEATSAAESAMTATQAHTAWRLIYEATGGVAEYSFDSGTTWTSITLSGSGMTFVDLTPAAAATTLRIRWVSGTIRLAGLDLRRVAKGIVWHKLGRSGSNTVGWTSGVDRTQWIAGFGALQVDAVVIFLGTNDATPGVTPEAFAANLVEMVGRIREAHPTTVNLPGPDIILCPSPECYRPTPIDMVPYLDATLAVADDLDAAVINLQGIFGDPATRRDWFDTNAAGTSNGLHPARSTSGLIVAKAMFEALRG